MIVPLYQNCPEYGIRTHQVFSPHFSLKWSAVLFVFRFIPYIPDFIYIKNNTNKGLYFISLSPCRHSSLLEKSYIFKTNSKQFLDITFETHTYRSQYFSDAHSRVLDKLWSLRFFHFHCICGIVLIQSWFRSNGSIDYFLYSSFSQHKTSFTTTSFRKFLWSNFLVKTWSIRIFKFSNNISRYTRRKISHSMLNLLATSVS